MTVLVVEHEADAPLGLLDRADLPTRVVRPYRGEEVPTHVGGFDGVVVLGGEMNADEDERYPWLSPTKALIRDAVAADVPTLLICLGHQLAAVALGGRVERSATGATWGTFPVGLTDEAASDRLVSLLPPDARVVHWNGDVVAALPRDAVVLACDPHGHPQIVRYAPRVWGLQCHPEVDLDIVARWAATQDPAHTERAQTALTSAEADLPAVHRDWRPVLDAFVSLVGRG